MRVYEEERGLLVLLQRGEKLVAGLTQLAKDRGLRGAGLSALGALCDVELGYYVLHDKRYERITLADDLELLSLTGNVTLKDGAPFVHVHASLGDREFRARGGHLFEATVGASVELRVERWSAAPVRKPDEAIGLALWHGCEW